MPNRIDDLKRFLEQKPTDPFLNYALGIEFANDGNDSQARTYFEYLLREHPDYFATYLHVGQLYERAGDEAAAIAAYTKGIEVSRAAGNSHAVSELQGALDLLGG